ncbi:MAG: DUF4202 domain-containing protein [Verrucomicrobia bacterium]|nr:DUF4202 domain-containing protein [Verrucomicrobiota bacterium]
MQRFDQANSLDPNTERDQAGQRPRELLYAERLSGWIERLKPDASEALRLAARCQHIRRWEIPRASFPQTREGYLKWKETLKRRHAEISGGILREVGYPEEMIRRVQALNLKRDLKQDDECQVLEDALCLLFLEHQLPALILKTPEEKIIAALRKSWEKMSPQGRKVAMSLGLQGRAEELLAKALQAT